MGKGQKTENLITHCIWKLLKFVFRCTVVKSVFINIHKPTKFSVVKYPSTCHKIMNFLKKIEYDIKQEITCVAEFSSMVSVRDSNMSYFFWIK